MRRFVFFAVLLAISLPVGLSTTGCAHDYGSELLQRLPERRSTQRPCQDRPRACRLWALVELWPGCLSVDSDRRQLQGHLGHGQVLHLWHHQLDAWPTFRLPVRFAAENGIATPATTFLTSPPAFLLSPAAQIFGNNGGVAYLTASGGGATSNPVPVFVHPPITSVLLGGSECSAYVSQQSQHRLAGKCSGLRPEQLPVAESDSSAGRHGL